MFFQHRLLSLALLPALLACLAPELAAAPKPRLKPENLTGGPTETAPEPAAAPLVFPGSFGQWPKDVVLAERKACARLLRGLSLKYETLPPLGSPGGCGAAAPVLISEIKGTRIVPPTEATCAFAEQLHGWVTSSLQPSAREVLGRRLVQIDNASGYACRRRNGLASGKLSEHAKANALDIAQLHFAGEDGASIEDDWSTLRAKTGTSKKAKFLALIRRDACIRFTTVLGPGSDRYHGDHFHVDYARRKNGYRICK